MCVGGGLMKCGVRCMGIIFYVYNYYIDDCVPHREQGSNKRYLTVLCKHEIV